MKIFFITLGLNNLVGIKRMTDFSAMSFLPSLFMMVSSNRSNEHADISAETGFKSCTLLVVTDMPLHDVPEFQEGNNWLLAPLAVSQVSSRNYNLQNGNGLAMKNNQSIMFCLKEIVNAA